MHTYLKTGELLKCRKCGTEGAVWFNGQAVGCSKCDVVITGDHAEAMCIEQKRHFEAGRYLDEGKQAGSLSGIPIPESVKKFRKQLGPGDRNYPLYCNLDDMDPNWPFHY